MGKAKAESFLERGAIISLKKDLFLIAWGESTQYETEAQLNPTLPAFYFPDFFLESPTPWFQYQHHAELNLFELLDLLPSLKMEKAGWQLGHQEEFRKAFDHFQEPKILEKVVPYSFAYTAEKMTSARLANSLRSALLNVQAYEGHLYGQWEGFQGFLGVTPEILFTYRRENPTILTTMALAGTLKPSSTLFLSEKLVLEHQLVVKFLTQTLNTLGKVRQFPIRYLHLAHLTHLMTPMEVELKHPFQFIPLVRQLHPTPALGTFPREKDLRWLRAYARKIPRYVFGAPIGVLWRPLAACYVAIRQVQWDARGMRMGAGCGIVKQSRYVEEWEELELKISAIKGVLDL